MAKIKLKLNDKHIALIKAFKFEKISDYKIGLDCWANPYGGDFLFEDLALILGYFDKAIPNTEFDWDGRKFGLENEKEMLDVHNYVIENIQPILDIIFKFLDKGGIKPGVYTCIDSIKEWNFEEKK